MGTINFDPVTFTLEFDPCFDNFNLAYNFKTVRAESDKDATEVPNADDRELLAGLSLKKIRFEFKDGQKK